MGRLLAAVDGGNSKTELVLFTEAGDVLASVRGGGSNPQKLGLDRVVGLVGELLGQALVEAGLVGARVDVLAAFLAGLDFPAEVTAARAALEDARMADEFVVDNDTFALLHGGSTRSYGVAVVCGAGINSVGVARSGQRSSFLSLGMISGDWGGSLCLGREVLWAAARAEDGRGEPTVLRDVLRDHFQVPDVATLIEQVHTGRVTDGGLAEVVPRLFEPGHADDPVVTGLLSRLSAEVSVTAEVMLRRTELIDVETDVVLGGAILTTGHRSLLDAIHGRLARTAPLAAVKSIEVRPVAGAAVAALAHAGAPAAAVQQVKSQLTLENR